MVVDERRRLDRATGGASRSGIRIAGVVFAVLFVVGMLLMASTPDYDAPDSEWTEWFEDSGNNWPAIVGVFLLAIAALVFCWFVATLVDRLRVARWRGHEHAALGFGLLFAAALGIGAAVTNSVSGAVEIGDTPIPSPDVAQQIESIGFAVVLVFGGFAASACVATVSALGSRRVGYPRWLVIAGYVAAVLLLLSAVFVPMLLLPLWTLAVAVAGVPKDELDVETRLPTATHETISPSVEGLPRA